MAESYREKMQKVRPGQKKRAEQRKKQMMMTGGLDELNVKSPKKTPAAMKEQKRKADIRKRNQRTLGSIFDTYVKGRKFKDKPTPARGKSPGALGGKAPLGKSPGRLKAEGTAKKTESIKGAAPTKRQTFKDFKTIAAAKKAGSLYYMGKDGKKKAAVTKTDLDKSGLSLRDYLNFMTGKTRKSSPMPKKKPTPIKTKMGRVGKGGMAKIKRGMRDKKMRKM